MADSAAGSRPGSAFAARARRDDAGYWTGASSAMSQPRCGNCTHCKTHPAITSKTKYDRWCDLHDSGVKTHGCCRQHQPRATT